MMTRRCAECSQLLAAAQKATINHIRLLSKLKLATLTRNQAEVDRLTTLVTDAAAVRHQSMVRYKKHCDGHRRSIDAAPYRVLS